MNSLNCRLLAVCLLSLLAAPAYAQQEQMQAEQQPPTQNYFYNNVPPATGGGYTGYGGEPAYYGDYNYRYQPMNSYYAQRPPWPNYNPAPYAVRPRFAYAPAGLVIPATLQTPISTQVAGQGDVVQASIDQNVSLQGLSYIPAGSALLGQVTESQGGRFFGRSGLLTMTFDQLRLPNGQTVPMQAHILGDIGKYSQKDGVIRGEGWGTKVGALALRTAIGAGSGAVLGTALGAIASHGAYVGTGAWAGTAIGGGIGVLDDLVARKGRNVLIRSGTPLQIQLDDPMQIPLPPQAGGQV